jgi:hypothetical protein
VDTSDFDRAQKVINNQTFNIGNVSGGQNQWGANSTQTNNNGPGGGGSAPPTPPGGGTTT